MELIRSNTSPSSKIPLQRAWIPTLEVLDMQAIHTSLHILDYPKQCCLLEINKT
jgi:hypothetical protein